MRWPRALALLVFLALLPSCIGQTRADPAMASMGPGEGGAVWTFSNPANYTLDNVALDLGARLAQNPVDHRLFRHAEHGVIRRRR